VSKVLGGTRSANCLILDFQNFETVHALLLKLPSVCYFVTAAQAVSYKLMQVLGGNALVGHGVLVPMLICYITIRKHLRQGNLERMNVCSAYFLEAGKSELMALMSAWCLVRTFLLQDNMAENITWCDTPSARGSPLL
jgi:hypothetical protein